MKNNKDKIIEEIRNRWEIYAVKFDHDIDKIITDLQLKERKWETKGFKFIDPIEESEQVEKEPTSKSLFPE
jgi:hypothetical protein